MCLCYTYRFGVYKCNKVHGEMSHNMSSLTCLCNLATNLKIQKNLQLSCIVLGEKCNKIMQPTKKCVTIK